MARTYNSIVSGTKRTKHGMTGTPEFITWNGMKVRCYKKDSKDYSNYGGRGIKICDKWLNNPALFFKDMGPKPSPSDTIERTDNDGDYEPGNCKWATKKEQSLNKRIYKNNKSGFIGVSKCRQTGGWIAQITINGKSKHLGLYNDIRDAVNTRLQAIENRNKSVMKRRIT